MSTANFGFPSDEAYRAEVAREIAEQEKEAERHSKPIYETGVAREASANQKLAQAAGKLAEALSDHAADMGVNDAFQGLHAMIEGSMDAEDAARAVTAFASAYPDYAPAAVEALEEAFGDWGREALEETVEQLSYAQAEQEYQDREAAWDEHITRRADVLRSVSNEIASKDGEAVRQVAAGMASQDESLEWTDDADAAARLMGYGKVAKDAQASAGKEAFLRSFDEEVERNGWAGRLWSDEDKAKYRREAAENTAKASAFDPETSFAEGRAATHRRIEQPFPFDIEDYNEELAKYDEPEWKAAARREIIAAQEAERREQGR